MIKLKETKTKDGDGLKAVVSSVLKYLGATGVAKIVADTLKSQDFKALGDYFRSLGFRSLSGEMDVGCLRHFTDKGWPVLTELGGRVVVVTGVENEHVYFLDSEDGNTDDPVSAFVARWGSMDSFQYGISVWQE